jgi:hypothetical protein
MLIAKARFYWHLIWKRGKGCYQQLTVISESEQGIRERYSTHRTNLEVRIVLYLPIGE